MRLLLRAITTPADSSGFVTVTANGLMAWASEVEDDQAEFSRDAMLEHHRVVADIDARVEACLPARFPTAVNDADALSALIASKGVELARQLERVRGCCELAVTVADPAAPDSPASGRQYLLARQKRYALARELSERVTSTLGGDLVASQTRVCPTTTVVLSMALLVPRPRVSEVVTNLRRVAADVRILVNGPWPPYSFARVTAD